MSAGFEDLRASAGAGLLWGVGFTVGRDVTQFLAMLILVRLLSPEIYGQAALAQTVIAFIAVLSFKTLAPYALQARDPHLFDWDTHFSIGILANTGAFLVTVVTAGALYSFGGPGLKTTASVLLVMSLIFPIEIVHTYYFVWLQAHHDWRRMRLLLLLGSLIGSGGCVILALFDAGVFALAASSILASLPLLVDFFFFAKTRPRFSTARLSSYRDGMSFGLNRAVSGGLASGGALLEQSLMTGIFGFSALGSFSRAIGLAQITSGRIGPVVVDTLYPVLTRVEAGSDRFRRFSGTLLKGVLWLSIPASVYVALEARVIVGLLYGSKWDSVVPLLPMAAAVMALRGVRTTVGQTMLANQQLGACLKIDGASALAQLVIIVVALPYGLNAFLLGLTIHAAVFVILSTVIAVRGGALEARAVGRFTAPCLLATGAGLAAHALTIVLLASSPVEIPAFFARSVVYALTYLVVLRATAGGAFHELLSALPLTGRFRRAIYFITFAPGPKL